MCVCVLSGFTLDIIIAWYIILVCMLLLFSGNSDFVLQVGFVGASGDYSVVFSYNLLYASAEAIAKFQSISIEYFFTVCLNLRSTF